MPTTFASGSKISIVQWRRKDIIPFVFLVKRSLKCSSKTLKLVHHEKMNKISSYPSVTARSGNSEAGFLISRLLFSANEHHYPTGRFLLKIPSTNWTNPKQYHLLFLYLKHNVPRELCILSSISRSHSGVYRDSRMTFDFWNIVDNSSRVFTYLCQCRGRVGF